MSLEHLRALALNYRPEARYSMCLDRDLQLERTELTTRIVTLQQQLTTAMDDPNSQPRQALGERPLVQRLTEQIDQATRELEALDEKAKPDSITLIFGRLPLTPDMVDEGHESYEGIVNELSDPDGRIDTDMLADRLLAACYTRCEAADGSGVVDLGWGEARATFGQQDLAFVRALILGHHITGAAVPFNQTTSGQPATT